MTSQQSRLSADSLASCTPRPAAAGFTLIELMITVVIATILLAIAIPLYQHQIRESRRTDARSALVDLAAREERYYATYNVYTSSAANLGYQGWGTGYPVGGGYYYLSAPTVPTSGATFTVTASPVTGKGQDQDADCTTFSVDNTGKQSATGANTASCWH